ncbi:MAG: hypothetical protein NT178_16665 [Proteobacteria bacterium]|nr:hypothetical protein [Pseudomonadota bacterium]
MKNIFITYCTGTKDDTLKDAGISVTPDVLYTSNRIRGFIRRCKKMGFKYAIFSDRYGVWFPHIKHPWYEKHPDIVTEEEYQELLNNFNQKLKKYDKIYFHYNPVRFHNLYKRLLDETELKKRITLFSHVSDIERRIYV